MKCFDFLLTAPDAVLITIIIAIISIVAAVLYIVLRNPYEYPYFYHKFDVSKKRNVNIYDYIDTFLSDPRNWQKILKHEQTIVEWKEKTERHANASTFPNRRHRQRERVIDDKHAYHFSTMRQQTRYRQKNYVKTSYKVHIIDSEWAVNWGF